jgi:hypothetical protein
MHGRFPTHNKYYLAHEIFPLLSKEEKRQVYFPSKEERSKKISKKDLRLSREDEEVLAKYRAK